MNQVEINQFDMHLVHPSWKHLVLGALNEMDPSYLTQLYQAQGWLPGPEKIFNAFSIPLANTAYILLGESPYPRAQSANGYAFWDNNVGELWSSSGLSKPVNRATSLRNIIKMLLVASNLLSEENTSQNEIAAIDKSPLVTNLGELFTNFLTNGFLLLNASLVYRKQSLQKDVKAWRFFVEALLQQLRPHAKQSIKLLLFGRVAQALKNSNLVTYECLRAEHPYNLSFIHNKMVLDFFRPLNLLGARTK